MCRWFIFKIHHPSAAFFRPTQWQRSFHSARRINIRHLIDEHANSLEHTETAGQSSLQTLAIESSCDDTSVAVLSLSTNVEKTKFRADVLFHDRITANSESHLGLHPVVALESHQTKLGSLVRRAVKHVQSQPQSSTSEWDTMSTGLADAQRARRSTGAWKPNFVSVTRGPGMRSNLSVGLDTAKGLAIAWDVPILGVHHMQAHTLTSRLCSILPAKTKTSDDPMLDRHDPGQESLSNSFLEQISPDFPFLTILASGGHTMLVNSKSLTDHSILAETADVAIGDCLDKSARAILPDAVLKAPYGKALEEFAFPDSNYRYRAPKSRGEEVGARPTRWGWSLRPPLADSRRMAYSFAGLYTHVERLIGDRKTDEDAAKQDISLEERRELAREVLRVVFEHLGSRVLLHLDSLPRPSRHMIQRIVVSGGVAANKFLRHVLRSMLDARGFPRIELSFPPAELCTDNALMIAWAGMEMYSAGYASDLSMRPIRKWSMDSADADGGILGVDASAFGKSEFI